MVSRVRSACFSSSARVDDSRWILVSTAEIVAFNSVAISGEITDRTDKLHFRVSGGIRQSRITVLLSSWARAGRAGRRFRRAFFDARR
jgi:hypothetical protein